MDFLPADGVQKRDIREGWFDVKDGTVENQGVVKVMLSRSKIPLNLPLQREISEYPL